MKTKQVYLRRLLVFVGVIVLGMQAFPSVVPDLAVRVFVPDAPPSHPAGQETLAQLPVRNETESENHEV